MFSQKILHQGVQDCYKKGRCSREQSCIYVFCPVHRQLISRGSHRVLRPGGVDQTSNIITKETIRPQNDFVSEFINQQLIFDIITIVLKTSKFSDVIRGFSDGICEFVDCIQ